MCVCANDQDVWSSKRLLEESARRRLSTISCSVIQCQHAASPPRQARLTSNSGECISKRKGQTGGKAPPAMFWSECLMCPFHAWVNELTHSDRSPPGSPRVMVHDKIFLVSAHSVLGRSLPYPRAQAAKRKAPGTRAPFEGLGVVFSPRPPLRDGHPLRFVGGRQAPRGRRVLPSGPTPKGQSLTVGIALSPTGLHHSETQICFVVF